MTNEARRVRHASRLAVVNDSHWWSLSLVFWVEIS